MVDGVTAMAEALGLCVLQPFVLFKVGQLEQAMAEALGFLGAWPLGFSTIVDLPPHTGPEIANTVGRRRNGRSIYAELARIASPCFDLEPELHLYLYAVRVCVRTCAIYAHIYIYMRIVILMKARPWQRACMYNHIWNACAHIACMDHFVSDAAQKPCRSQMRAFTHGVDVVREVA